MMDDILPVNPLPLPFNEDDKIFSYLDDEGQVISEPYSYNDWIQEIKNISGVNQD